MAIKVHSFIGKVNIEGLHMMDDHINEWMRRNKITPVHIKQVFGTERHHGTNEEPIMITSIWYEHTDNSF